MVSHIHGHNTPPVRQPARDDTPVARRSKQAMRDDQRRAVDGAGGRMIHERKHNTPRISFAS